MNEFVIDAKVENLDDVIGYVEEQLEECGCPMKLMIAIDVAVEEIFVNIASYAYDGGEGSATIRVGKKEDASGVMIQFADSGIPYDPLAKEDPDVTLSVEERQIGGLGIFMVKKSMDEVIYEYKDGQNVLTLIKNF